MQELELYKQLTEIFHDLFDDDTLVLTRELTASEVPEWDSFKIKFQTAELESLQTVGHLVDLMEKKLAAQGR